MVRFAHPTCTSGVQMTGGSSLGSMGLLCELTPLVDVFQRDDSVRIFRLFVAIEQLVEVAIAFSQQPAANLVDFFDDGIVVHDSSSSGVERISSGVTTSGVGRCNAAFASNNRRITSPLAMWRQFHVTK